MKTQTHLHRLEGGQALALQGAGRAVLAHGELLVQQPARWLGGMVVLPAPQRIVAPSVLPADASLSFVAVRGSSVVEQAATPWSSRGMLLAAVAWLRGQGEGAKPAGQGC